MKGFNMYDELELREFDIFEYECGTATFIDIFEYEPSNDSQEKASCPRCVTLETSF